MANLESPLHHENELGRKVTIYTPATLQELKQAELPKFYEAVDLLRASIEELRDINGVHTTEDDLQDHEIISTEAEPKAPTLRMWDSMMKNFPVRVPFLIAIENQGKVAAVCEGRVYDFVYNRAQVAEGTEQPVQEKAIFIQQTGVRPDMRGHKKDNIADQLYTEIYELAVQENITLLIGAVNTQNERSRRVVERQGRKHISTPRHFPHELLDPTQNWPQSTGAYLPNPEWDDTDSEGKPIHVVLEYYTQRL